MNPDREEFLISQTVNKILNFKYLGEKANFLNGIKKECAFFRSLMLNKKILNILNKIKNKKISALMSQMIFKEKKTKYAKQSWLPHQDNSYPKNKNGHYITINIFMNKSTKIKINFFKFIYQNIITWFGIFLSVTNVFSIFENPIFMRFFINI